MVWGHLAVAAVSIGANLLIRYTQSDPEVRRVGLLRGRPSINAQYVLGQSRAPAYMVGHRVAAEPFVGVTTESDSGFRSIHLALCLSEGACEDLLGVWFNDIYYRLSRVRTEIDGAVLYNSHDRIAPYASRRGNLFEVRGCLDATGMQGAVYRRALGLPAGAPFLKYISWAHVVLQQPGNADDPARIHKWQRVPDISFLMKGMKVPPATAPGDPARWTPDATDLRYWFMRERLKIPAAEINAPSVAAARAITSPRIRTDLDGAYWRYSPEPDPPNAGGAWTAAEPVPTARSSVVWAAWAPRIVTGNPLADNVLRAADREWTVFPYKVRRASGTVETIEALPVDVDVRYLLGTTGYEAGRYEMNGILGGEGGAQSADDEMDFAWQGYVVRHGGQWHLLPGADRAARFAWDASGALTRSCSVGPQLAETTNAVAMSLEQSAPHGYRPLALPLLKDAAEIARDGVEAVARIRRLALVGHPITAGRLGATFLRRCRQDVVYQYEFGPPETPDWYRARPFDAVTVTDPHFGVVARRMLLQDITYRSNGNIQVTLCDAPEGAYPDTIDLPAADDRPVIIGATPAPANVAASVVTVMRVDGTTYPRIVVTWDAAPHRAEVRYRAVGIGTDLADGETSRDPVGSGLWTRADGVSAAQTDYETITIDRPPVHLDAEWLSRWEIQVRHIGRQSPSAWTAAVTIETLPTIDESPQNATAILDDKVYFSCDAPVRRDIVAVEIAAGVEVQEAGDFDGTTHPVTPGREVFIAHQPDGVDIRTTAINHVQARFITAANAVSVLVSADLAEPESSRPAPVVVEFLTRDATNADAGVKGRFYIRLISADRARVWSDNGTSVTLIAVSPQEINVLLAAGTEVTNAMAGLHGRLFLIEE